MEITLRLHPTLHWQLHSAAVNSQRYRKFLALVAAEAIATVARHGGAITCAPLNLIRLPLDRVGCAMSAFTRGSRVVVDVDPFGTARGEAAVLWQPRTIRPFGARRPVLVVVPAHCLNGAHVSTAPKGSTNRARLTLTLPPRRAENCPEEEGEFPLSVRRLRLHS